MLLCRTWHCRVGQCNLQKERELNNWDMAVDIKVGYRELK